MIDLSWSELLVCAVIALVFVGPKDMPKMLKSVSRGVRQVRHLYQQAISGFHALEREVDFATGQGVPPQISNPLIPNVIETDDEPELIVDDQQPTRATQPPQ